MSRKVLSILIVASMLAVLLAACGGTPETIIETVVQTVEVEKTVVETVVETIEVTPVVEEDPTALPREETMYFNGRNHVLQWSTVGAGCWLESLFLQQQ